MLGGIFAIKSPRAAVFFTSGPDASNEYAKPVIDDVSKERSKMTGYAALFLGVGVCAAGVLMKNFKIPAPHDTAA